MKSYLLILFLLIPLLGFSQTSRTWTGATSTDWNTAGNWSPSGVPSSTDHIVLNTASGNQPVLDANRSITNITVSAGAIDLNGYTLTVTGTTSLTGGNINNGTITFNNTTTTIAGTTFGAKVTANTGNIYFNGSIFNNNVTVVKTANTANTSTGGNTFNDTLDIRNSSSSVYIILGGTNADTYNDNVLVSCTSTGGIEFGSSTTSSGFTLASGKKILIGSGGFSAGWLGIYRFTQTGSTAHSFTLTGTAGLSIGVNGPTTWNAPLTISTPNINLRGSTFNGKVTITKTANTANNLYGGNIFNDTLDIRNASSSVYLILGATLADTYNENVLVSCTSTGGIEFGSATTTSGFTLASGKKLLIGTGGFSAGNLGIYRFTQTGTAAHNFTLTGSASLYIGLNGATTWSAPLTISAPNVNIDNSTFNKKVVVTKTGNTSNSWSTQAAGNTFNDTLEIYNTNTSGSLNIASVRTDTYNENVWVSNTSSNGIYFGSTNASSGFTLASGKRILIGTGGFSAGTLGIYRFTQTGTAAHNFTLTGTASLYIGYQGPTTWSAPLTISAPNVYLDNSTFNKKVVVTKTSNTPNSWSTQAAGNTFNDTLEIYTTNTSGSLNIASVRTDTYNENVWVSNTSSNGIYFGSTNASSGFTLASGKRILIGTGGFSAGTLGIYRFTQTGTAAHNFTLTGTASLYIGYQGPTTWSAPLTISAPNVYLDNSTFNKKVVVTKTSNTPNSWSTQAAGNTFNDTLEVYNTSTSGFINLAANRTDTYNENVWVSNTSSNGINFGSTNGSSGFTLASGKRILIGTGGFSAGTLGIYRFTQTGTAAHNFTLTGNASIYIGINGPTTWSAPLTISAPNVYLDNSTFNKKVSVTKTGNTSNNWSGGNVGTSGNVYNDTLEVYNTSTSGFINLAASRTDTYNENVWVSNTSSNGISFGSTNASSGFTLASGKRILIGTGGFSAGNLGIYRFTQTGTAAHNFTLTGTASLYIGYQGPTTWSAPLTISAPNVYLDNSTFNKKVTISNSPSINITWTGNTYNDTLDYRYTGGVTNNALTFLNSTANGDVYISASNAYNLYFGSATVSTNKFILAANKRIKIGSPGWNNGGTINLSNVEFNDTNPFTISLGTTTSIQLGNYTFNTTYNLPININSGYISLAKGIFNKKVTLTKTATAAGTCYGGNTFNDTLDIRLQASDFTMSRYVGDVYNDDIYVSNISSGSLNIGNWLGVASTQSISNKIYIGTAGFASGSLVFNQFSQLDTTTQSLTLTGTATLLFNHGTWHSKLITNAPTTSIQYATFNNKVEVTTNSIYTISYATFNKPFILIKNSTASNAWQGVNTFNDTTRFIIRGGSINTNQWANSTHNGDLYVSNTGTGTLRLGYYSYYVSFENNKRIFIGPEGFASGAFLIDRIMLHGTTQPLNITLTGTASLSCGNQVTDSINVPVKLDAYNIASIGGRFNKKLTVKAVSGGWWGNNIITNDTFDLRCTGPDQITLAYAHATFNGPTFFSNSNTGGFRNIYGSTITISGNGYIAAGPDGFSNGTLALSNITQTNTKPQNITFTGTAVLALYTSTFNAPIAIAGYSMSASGCRFKKKVTRNKTGGSSSTGDGLYYGTVFEDTLILNNQSNGSISFGGWASAGDTLKGDVYLLNSSGGGTFNFNGPGGGSTNYCTLTSGKRLIADSSTFKGNINFMRFQQLGATAQTLLLSKASTITFNAGNIFNGAIDFTAGSIASVGSTYNNTVSFTKLGSANNAWSGNIIYNANVTIENKGTGTLSLSSDTYNANVTFTKSGSGDINLTNGTSTFKGDVTLNGMSNTQFTGSQVALFTGTASQTINQSGGSLNFGRVTINKASNNLTLGAPLTVSTALTLTNGKLITTSTNLLTFADNATVSGVSNSSYVEGPMAKVGNDAFTFPTGKGGTYRGIGISAPSSTTTVFTAEYFNANQTYGTTLASPLSRISNCEYWTLARTGTSSNAAVTLNWGTGSCYTSNPSLMKVASWNGSQWVDGGNASNTGTNLTGSVTSSSLSAFTAFTTGNNCTNTVSITPTPTDVSNVCPGVSVTLTSSSATAYLWSTTATTQAINPTTGATYTVTAYDANNCATTASQVVGFSTITAAITATPGTPINICETETVTLTSNTATSYSWSPGGATTSSINPTTDGTYTLTTYDAGGCSATDEIEVSFLLLPEIPSIPTGTAERCSGVGSDNYITETDNYTGVEWTLSPTEAGTVDFGGESATITWDADYSGTATLTVIATNSCGSEERSITIDITSPMVYYADFDGDGLGNPMIMVETCPQPDGYVESSAGFDCDDNVPVE